MRLQLYWNNYLTLQNDLSLNRAVSYLKSVLFTVIFNEFCITTLWK